MRKAQPEGQSWQPRDGHGYASSEAAGSVPCREKFFWAEGPRFAPRLFELTGEQTHTCLSFSASEQPGLGLNT